MEWHTEHPTKPGVYWFRYKEDRSKFEYPMRLIDFDEWGGRGKWATIKDGKNAPSGTITILYLEKSLGFEFLFLSE